jgi:hypothetical protein
MGTKFKYMRWLIISILFVLSCKKEYFAIALLSKFDKDRVEIEYDSNLVFDSIVSTNYSIMMAHKMAIQKQKDKILKVTLNDTISRNLLIDQNTKVILVRLRNDSLILEKSGPLKGPWY